MAKIDVESDPAGRNRGEGYRVIFQQSGCCLRHSRKTYSVARRQKMRDVAQRESPEKETDQSREFLYS
ncbi:MAG: hypothetical protein IJ088_01255 [Clostridia bacterium]|nr:hypothetical protein [Clostridia bacterium]